MSFEVILTKETSAKVSQIATKIADWLKQSSNNQVIYLVPDHIKFSAELEMIQEVGQLLQQPKNSYAVTKLQVYSFKRLAIILFSICSSSTIKTFIGAPFMLRYIFVL